MKKLNKWLAKFQQSDVKLTPVEKYSIRLAYMGTGILMVAPHLLPTDLGVGLYITSILLLSPQVIIAKQWNLVILNINGIIAYTILFFNN